MLLSRGVVHTQIEDCSEDELHKLVTLLTFTSGEEDKCLITDSGRFYTGLLPLLAAKNFNLQFLKTYKEVKVPLKNVQVNSEILQGRTLRDYQIIGTKKILVNGRGTIQAPTGSGKTSMAAAAILHFRELDLVDSVTCLTPSVFLMDQMATEFEQFGVGDVIRVGGKHKYPKSRKGRDVAVFVVNSAVRALASNKNGAGDFIKSSSMLLLDEAHHSRALSWTRVCESCPASIRVAYTATVYENPSKWSYDDLVLLGLVGRVIFDLPSKVLRDRGFLADPLVTFLPCRSNLRSWNWHTVYDKGIAFNKSRNSMIISLAASCYKANNKVMIFVGRKKQGHELAQKIAFQGCEAAFVHGGSKVYVYTPSGTSTCHSWAIKQIAEYVNTRDRCVLIGTQVLDEGVDIPIINVLIMAAAMQKYRRTVQRSGRGMRPKEGQNKVFLFDFWDHGHSFLLKHSEYRKWTYEQEEFDMSDSLSATESVMGCSLDVRKNLT